MKRILICGGRDFDDFGAIYDSLLREDRVVVIVGYDPGQAYPSGADERAYQAALAQNLPVWCFPYRYTEGPAGGPLRNREMLEVGKPDEVWAFPGSRSRGTWNMVNLAKQAGVPVRVWRHGAFERTDPQQG